MKPLTVIVISEHGGEPWKAEIIVKNEAQVAGLIREAFPARPAESKTLNNEYPFWTWFLTNPLPSPPSIHPHQRTDNP
jgi:hypothetical protein